MLTLYREISKSKMYCAIDDQVVNVGTTMVWRPSGIKEFYSLKELAKHCCVSYEKKTVVYTISSKDVN